MRKLLEHEEEYSSRRAEIEAISEKIGCTAEILRRWVRQAERDTDRREGADHGRA